MSQADTAPQPASLGATPPRVLVRRYLIDDPITEITQLLHRAYAPQVLMGLRPLAGRQEDRTTLDRVLNSECYLAILPEAEGSERGRIVGIILFNEHERVAFPEFFLRPEVSHFAMFGVEPSLQGLGIGRVLLGRCEERARELGSSELALSMAEPDTALRAYYERRGYRFVEHWQWPYTNYRSCILSKRLD
ncbi:MAG TPA: GNAT family N-acetyltransferase [Phycisphaerales bacterium]|nr:GNAT family N-acetyltransferase [Phycisphaerales bacterium]